MSFFSDDENRDRFIYSILHKLRGRRLRIDEAYHLISEILYCMEHHDAERVLTEIHHRFIPEIQRHMMEEQRTMMVRNEFFKNAFMDKELDELIKTVNPPKRDFIDKKEMEL